MALNMYRRHGSHCPGTRALHDMTYEADELRRNWKKSFALLGWLVLVFAGRMRWAARLICGVVIPLMIAVLYIYLIAAHFGETQGGFGTLDQVAALFSNKWLLLAGWIHYLAFDLFIGSWEVRDAQVLGISHLIVIPCLVLTFMFGPAGLLLYFLARIIRTRSLEIGTSSDAISETKAVSL